MSWNYRIIHHTEHTPPYYDLHEVFYKDNKTIEFWTQDAIDFSCDEEEGVKGIINSLELALKDARKHPALDYKIDLEPILKRDIP